MGRIVRAISADASVVCSAIDGKDIIAEIEKIHKTSAVVTAALGRLTMAASLMGFGLKGEKEHTQKEVADVLGISQSYISRLEKRIIARLKKEMEKAG